MYKAFAVMVLMALGMLSLLGTQVLAEPKDGAGAQTHGNGGFGHGGNRPRA